MALPLIIICINLRRLRRQVALSIRRQWLCRQVTAALSGVAAGTDHSDPVRPPKIKRRLGHAVCVAEVVMQTLRLRLGLSGP